MRFRAGTLLLGILAGFPIQEVGKKDADPAFWAFAEDLRKVADGGASVEYKTLEAFYKSRKAEEINAFWTGLVKRLEESYRWDVWAVGAILDGHLDVDFMLDYQVWIILKGRECYEGTLKDPRTVLRWIDADAPSNSFNAIFHRTAASNVHRDKTGRGLPNVVELRKDKEPAGKKWHWKDLSKLHPELWEKYFIKRDRRPLAPDKPLKDDGYAWHAVEPLWDWVDIYSEPEYYLEQIKLLSKGQRSLIAVLWLHSECNNGGMDQFFHNSTGILAPEALEGLKLFGAKNLEKNLAELMAAFPGGTPDRDCAKRRAQMEKRWGEKRSDDEFPGKPEEVDLETTIAKYIREHPGEFFRPPKK